MQDFFSNRGSIFLTFLVAVLLFIFPWPNIILWAQPVWPLLVLVFWLLVMPLQISFFTAFLLGLMLDLLTGSLLGQYAFAFIVITYVVLRLKPRLRVSSEWRQGMVVALFSAFLAVYKMLIMLLVGQSIVNLWLGFLPALSSFIVWPYFFRLMRKCRYRFFGKFAGNAL